LKNAFKKLVTLIYTGLASGNLTVGATELKQAINDFESAFRQSVIIAHPHKTNNNLQLICTRLAMIIYDLDVAFNCHTAQKKLIRFHICCLYNRLHSILPHMAYHQLTAGQLLQHKTLRKKLQAISLHLQDNGIAAGDWRTILQPHISAVQKTAPLSFPHWYWWSCFYANAETLQQQDEQDALEHQLIVLNFNTPGFCRLLSEKFKMALAALSSIEEQASFICSEIIKYKLLPQPHLAFTPGISVRRFMLGICKTELKCRMSFANKKEIGVQPLGLPPFTLQTCLTVQQVALLVRLHTETGVIRSENHTALLKQLAAVLSTPQTANVSAESLRVKFYTPDKAARDILKDYLFMMINKLRDL
jgi:hypothetical protein